MSQANQSETVLFAVDNGVATITLNRPTVGNAVDLELARAMVDVAVRCDQDPAIRCVVLTGAGRLFCAGGDIGLMQRAGDAAEAALSELAGTLHIAITRLARMRKPLVCAVNGAAAGAGLSLAIMGDVVLAARSAQFTTAYGAIGLTPDGGATWMLPRLIGLRRAQEMIITNRRVSAAEAEAMGLVTRAVDDEALVAEAAKLAAQLSKAATGAIGAARALLLGSYGTDLETQLELECRGIAAAAGSAEGREGVAAFLARRKPNFSQEN